MKIKNQHDAGSNTGGSQPSPRGTHSFAHSKSLLAALGFFLMAIGAVGILVPVWPTTPFVLLAASCFAVSPPLRARILQITFLREHMQNYKARTGLPKRNVAFSLSFLWSMLLVSILTAKELWAGLALAVVGIAVTIHILCISQPKKSGAKTDKRHQAEPQTCQQTHLETAKGREETL